MVADGELVWVGDKPVLVEGPVWVLESIAAVVTGELVWVGDKPVWVKEPVCWAEEPVSVVVAFGFESVFVVVAPLSDDGFESK